MRGAPGRLLLAGLLALPLAARADGPVDPHDRLFSALATTLEAEPVDAAWAPQAEAAARGRLSQQALRRARLVSLSCHSRLCREVVDLPVGILDPSFQARIQALLPPEGIAWTRAEGEDRARVEMVLLRPGVNPDELSLSLP